jgi:hypothetical protein
MSHIEGNDDGVGYGIYGQSNNRQYGTGVRGYSNNQYGTGVQGISQKSVGVYGKSNDGDGVRGISINSSAIDGYSVNKTGVFGLSSNGIGLFAGNNNFGYAVFLSGLTFIRGRLEISGGSFKIDHPLSPRNKYLHHSFVQSSEMKNVYDGIVTLDNNGEAEVDLPKWFNALNSDFRYQLTAIGAPGPNLHIAEEISELTKEEFNSSNNNNRFKIAGGTTGMKVSWQVTGIRNDPWANANRIQVEEDKPTLEQGYYIYPDLYGQEAEKGLTHLLFPEVEKNLKDLINENQDKV